MSNRRNYKTRYTDNRPTSVKTDHPLRIARRKEDLSSTQAIDEPSSSSEIHSVKIFSGKNFNNNIEEIKLNSNNNLHNNTRSKSSFVGNIGVKKGSRSEGNSRVLLKNDIPVITENKKRESSFPGMKMMADALRLIDDDENCTFLDFCKEYLLDGNKNFTVIGAIGTTGSGKSTVLSMLAGNDQFDMYRQYVFRPCSREGMESCRYQTTKIYVYISKWRTIFLDCQGLGNSSLFEEFVRSHRRLTQPAEQFELVSLQILSLMVSVCHTLLLCVDWFIDMNVIRDLLKTEVYMPLEMSAETLSRKVNVVIIHNRAKYDSFDPLMVTERMRMLKSIFDNSIFSICGGVNMAGMGFDRYRLIDSDVNYVLLSEIKMKKLQHVTEIETMSNVIDYGNVIKLLRTKLLQLPKYSFPSCSEHISEIGWFQFAAKTWEKILRELADNSKLSDETKSRGYLFRIQSNRRRILKGAIDNLHYNSGTSTSYYQSNENRRYGSRNGGRLRLRTTNKHKKGGDRSRQQFYSQNDEDDDEDVDVDDDEDDGDEKTGVLNVYNDALDSKNQMRNKYEGSRRRNESQIDEYDFEIKTKDYQSNQEDDETLKKYDSLHDLSVSQSSSNQIQENKCLRNNRRKLYTNELHQSTSTSNSDS